MLSYLDINFCYKASIPTIFYLSVVDIIICSPVDVSEPQNDTDDCCQICTSVYSQQAMVDCPNGIKDDDHSQLT